MKYLSGIHALNLPCQLNTPGDWHQSGIRWDVVDKRIRESDDSVFKDYGIEKNRSLYCYEAEYPSINIANHIRACLDLIEDGNFGLVQGMRDDFIVDEGWNEEIFDKVSMLRNSDNWKNIDAFMGSEYAAKWLRYKRAHQI